MTIIQSENTSPCESGTRGLACIQALHYALAWSDVFTFDYSSAGLQFAKETRSFVQAPIRISPTLPDEW